MGLIIEITFIIVIIIILLTNIMLYSISKKLKRIPNETELSGFEIAKKISSKVAKEEPLIIKKNGKFLDYYDYTRNVIKLSPEVFDGTDMYATIIALNIALETNKEKENFTKKNNMNSFLVLASYIVIIIGALLNNNTAINLGLVMFILAFIMELIFCNIYGKNKDEIEETYRLIKKEKIIKPFEKHENDLILLTLLYLARLPYGFINNFR